MANEEALRRKAVEMYRDGQKPAKIARELGKSRQWVYKWIDRSKERERKGGINPILMHPTRARQRRLPRWRTRSLKLVVT